MKWKVSIKRKDTGKWWNIGNVAQNKWGNYQVSIKMCDEFREHCKGMQNGEWVNLSMFEDKEVSGHDAKKADGYQPEPFDDEIPF